jgi:hypothetical protein
VKTVRALLFPIILAQAAFGCGTPTLPSFADPPPEREDDAANGDEDAGAEDNDPGASD